MCQRKIQPTDDLIVQSFGTSEWCDRKTGKPRQTDGPVYIHFHDECLKSFDKNTHYGPGEQFTYNRIDVDPETLKELSDQQKKQLKEFGIIVP